MAAYRGDDGFGDHGIILALVAGAEHKTEVRSALGASCRTADLGNSCAEGCGGALGPIMTFVSWLRGWCLDRRKGPRRMVHRPDQADRRHDPERVVEELNEELTSLEDTLWRIRDKRN